MIDLQSETILSLSQAVKALPYVDGKRPHISTIWRWARKGLRGIHLEYVRLGHRVCTSEEALNRFANRLAEADPPIEVKSGPLLKTPVTNAARRRSAKMAEDELTRRKICP